MEFWRGQLVGKQGSLRSRQVSTSVKPPPLTKHLHIINSVAAMDQTQSALQRYDQKRKDNIKRIRGTLEAGKSPLTKAKKDIILE